MDGSPSKAIKFINLCNHYYISSVTRVDAISCLICVAYHLLPSLIIFGIWHVETFHYMQLTPERLPMIFPINIENLQLVCARDKYIFELFIETKCTSTKLHIQRDFFSVARERENHI